MSSRVRWECAISVWPYQVTVYCAEDDIRAEVAKRLATRHDVAGEDLEHFEIEDTINLSEAEAA